MPKTFDEHAHTALAIETAGLIQFVAHPLTCSRSGLSEVSGRIQLDYNCRIKPLIANRCTKHEGGARKPRHCKIYRCA